MNINHHTERGVESWKEFSSFQLLFDVSKPIEKNTIIDEIFQNIKTILIKEFPYDSHKVVVYDLSDRLNFSCPYCGDSEISSSKKRGNLYKDNLMYHCYNCTKHRTIISFYKDFGLDIGYLNVAMLNEYIQDHKDHIDYSNRHTSKTFTEIASDNKEVVIQSLFSKSMLFKMFNLVEIESNTKIRKYLESRLQFDFTKFGYNEIRKQLYIFNLYEDPDFIIGFQIRNMNSDSDIRYITYKNSKIRTLLKLEPSKHQSTIDVISRTFGIFQLNVDVPITVFEGPLDSFLLKNSIGICSAHNNIPITSNEIRIMFDSDIAGIKSSMKWLDKGYYVFLWKKFLEDSTYQSLYTIKTDWTDVMVWAQKNNKTLPNIDNYFSKDLLDILWM